MDFSFFNHIRGLLLHVYRMSCMVWPRICTTRRIGAAHCGAVRCVSPALPRALVTCARVLITGLYGTTCAVHVLCMTLCCACVVHVLCCDVLSCDVLCCACACECVVLCMCCACAVISCVCAMLCCAVLCCAVHALCCACPVHVRVLCMCCMCSLCMRMCYVCAACDLSRHRGTKKCQCFHQRELLVNDT